MPKTVPNQKTIVIQKPVYKSNWLQVGNDEWVAAAGALKPSAFLIYLYLAGNMDGYELGISQVAIEEKLGIKKTAYHESINQLINSGYLTLLEGNMYLFTTSPNT